MVTRTATVGDTEVTVEVDFPVYYMFRHRDDDEEPFMFLVIRNVEEDVGYPPGIAAFLRKNFLIERIKRSEAETYEVIGIAPVYTRTELNAWLVTLNAEIRRSVATYGMEEGRKVRCGKYVYDLTTKWKEFEKPW